MTDEMIIRKIRYGIMRNDEWALSKSLWRLAHGNKDTAYKIIRDSAPHYGITAEQCSEILIEVALGELNGGVEVEWAS